MFFSGVVFVLCSECADDRATPQVISSRYSFWVGSQ